ncbi:MAG: hypothetical protein Q9185_004992 [Variospora sp. 1 TL-2023]
MSASSRELTPPKEKTGTNLICRTAAPPRTCSRYCLGEPVYLRHVVFVPTSRFLFLSAAVTDSKHAPDSLIMTSWWTDARINTTVTREYVVREVGPKKSQDALHHPLGFGDGLTDDTYLDWILEKGRRCFLILNFIGVPERIFQLIDKSLDDDDLPLTEDALFDLNLFGGRSETLDKKFYRQQFSVLVQDLVPGGHQDFGADEVVPLEPRNGRKGSISGASQTSDRVYVQQKLYTRKKIPTSGDNGVDRVHFVMHLKALQALKHPHLISVWATYAQQNFSYMLLYPTTELSLKQFLDDQPKFFKSLEKQQRRNTLLRWTHCVIAALAYLHDHGLTHQSIRPSNVTIDGSNTIYLANFAALNAFDSTEGRGSTYRTEIYEHAAPENWRRKPSLYDMAPDKTIHPGGGRTGRRIKEPTKAPSVRPSSSFFPNQRTHSATTTTSSSNSSSNTGLKKTLITTFSPAERFAPAASPADVFSMSTIVLHLATMLLGHSPKAFASHRARHNRQAGRGGAPADASFHVNLTQVGTWMEMLMKDALEREKKDQKGKGTGRNFWRSVGGVVHSAEAGLRREPKERHTAGELETKIGKYVGRALGDIGGIGCGCQLQDEDAERERVRAEKGKNREETWEQEEESVFGEPKYRLSIPATVTTNQSMGTYSTIDQERRLGMLIPVMENWPLRA